MQIQISWLLQKPTDLDLHCLQRQGIPGFSRTRVNLKALILWWKTQETCQKIKYTSVQGQGSSRRQYAIYKAKMRYVANSFKNDNHNCFFNLYHAQSLGIFSRQQIYNIFLIFSRKQALTFHANCLHEKQFAWNVKGHFWRKTKKKISKCCLPKILPRLLSTNP